jgi:hypothetical protein
MAMGKLVLGVSGLGSWGLGRGLAPVKSESATAGAHSSLQVRYCTEYLKGS